MEVPLLRSIPVVGLHFRNDEEKAISKMGEVGDEVILEAEKDNPHDVYAVAIKVDTGEQVYHIGYLPAMVSPMLSLYLQQGQTLKAKISVVTGAKLFLNVVLVAEK